MGLTRAPSLWQMLQALGIVFLLIFGGLSLLFGIVWLAVHLLSSPAQARDDGRYAGSPLKPWFDQLKSPRGRCCSDADGRALSDPDWEMAGGHYRVRLEGEWVDVPDDALVDEPNRYGQAMVWPYHADGKPMILCFMPGANG